MINMKQKANVNQMAGILLLGICVFLTAVSVYLSFSNDIWYDELFSVGLADSSLPQLLSLAARDVHPPLYYLILKTVWEICKAIAPNANLVVTAKLVSVLPFVLLMIYGVTKVRRHFGMLSAGIFCFLVYTMPHMSAYTTEIRMYGFCIFFITAGVLHAYEITLTDGIRITQWISLTLYALAAAYTHYFAFAAAGMIYLYLFVWLIATHKSGRYWIAWGSSVGAATFAYLPWITAVITQVGKVKENYWILPLTWRSIGGCIKFLFKPAFTADFLNTIMAVILFVLFGIVILAGIMNGKKTGRKEENSFVVACLGILAGVVIFGFAASFLLRPVFIYRYMLPAMGAFWLAFAICLGQRIEKIPWCYLILLLFVVVGLRNYRAYYGEEMWKRVQMYAAEEALEQIKPEDKMIFNFNHAQGVVSYYLDNETYLYNDRPEELIQEMFPRVKGMQEAESIGQWLDEGADIWFLGSGNAGEELRIEWAEQGIDTEMTGSFLIESYWFNLYKLKTLSE